MTSLTVVVEDVVALRTLFEEQLSKGRAFVRGAEGVMERQACVLVIACQGREHRLAGEVVHVRSEEPGRGVGLQLARLGTADAEALRAFALGEEGPAPPAAEGEPVEASVEEAGDAARAEGGGAAHAASLHERMRNLTGPEQQRLASGGTLTERTALEQMYGPSVWEALIRNPRLTVPEVARIARKGTLPRPLVELIATNAPWLAAGEVQRALLANRRSSPTVVQKVLGAMSRHDLQLVPQQTAYPEPVRAAAKKRLGL